MLETATNTGLTSTDRASVARVRDLLERCAERERVSDRDWAYEENGVSYREFVEGWLAKAKVDEDWVLYRCTQTTHEAIARGPLAEIECDTREFVRFGPPGGLDDGAGPRSWELDEGALHATTIGGMFRLMLQPNGRGTLLYIRNDFNTDVLGDDNVETLKRTADDLRRRHRGDPLRVRVAGERVEIHGVGRLGVVGQVELMRGTRLVLVLGDDDDQFDLYFVHRAGTYEFLDSYSGADLRRGDLGSIFGALPVQSAESVRTSPSQPASDGPALPRAGGRTPPHHGRTPPSRATNRASPRTTQPVLTDDDARRLETALTPDEEKWTGDGVTTLPYFFAAFDILIRQRKLKNMCLWCPSIRKLMAKEANVTVPGEPRTFARGFALFVGITGLGTKRGRQWEIPFADFKRSGSAGMTRIREMHEPAPTRNTEPSAPAASAPTTKHARSATHARLTTTPTPTPTSPTNTESAETPPAVSTPPATLTSPIMHATPTPTPSPTPTTTMQTNNGSAETPPAPSTPTATLASPIMHATVTPTPTTPTNTGSAVTPPAASAPTATLGSATLARSTTPQTPATAVGSAVTQPSILTPTATPVGSATLARSTTPQTPATAAASAVTQRLTATPTAAHAGTGKPSPPPATSTTTAAATSMSPPPSADPGAMSAPTPAASTVSTATLPGAPSEGLPGETGSALAEPRATGPPLTDVQARGPPLTDNRDEPADDGCWHPTAWEPLRIKLPTEPGPSQWNGKKPRGPPKG